MVILHRHDYTVHVEKCIEHANFAMTGDSARKTDLVAPVPRPCLRGLATQMHVRPFS